MKKYSQLAEDLKSHEGLSTLFSAAAADIDAAATLAEIEDARVKHLGRKSVLSQLLRSIPELPNEEKPVVGKYGNQARAALEQAINDRKKELESGELERRLATEQVDITLPGEPFPRGHLHIINQTLWEIEDIFAGLGYRIAEGPEVETDYYNFTALNTPEGHPARSSHDTFFVDGDPEVLLRTHTSPVQIRLMEKEQPPIYAIMPGRVYRRDSDATHTPMFHQIEGLAVDEHITMADLKGTLETFMRAIFGADRIIRLRPHFFPFTEPSVEMDVSCMICGGDGCRSCKHSGWLEILGAGMVDPNVFGFVDYDTDRVQGFAFGMGVERIAMLKHGMTDLRMFYDNDLRFIRQF
ncbi:MAG: phenylalanine--tRNA ligase subunit alpha [Actinobacteria bacterium]|nr:phenylalanine--tRNA ligase subunit alpha [Actinomycetota bacterium]